MKYRDILTIFFGLHIIWTGLWRNIQAAAYKPNEVVPENGANELLVDLLV